MRLGIRLALRALELMPFPWRFSRLPAEARSRYLADADASAPGPGASVVLLVKTFAGLGYASHPSVTARIGTQARCATAGEAPPPPGSLGTLEPEGDAEECEVAVIGSGAGGAAAAVVLAEAGRDVIVLEEGLHRDRETYPGDPLEALATLYREGGLTVAEGSPPIPLPVGRAVGGTTVINSGTCFRPPPQVLERWRLEHGIGWAGELGDELDAAERMLHVRRVPADRVGGNGGVCIEGAAALGVEAAPIPRNAGDCVQCSSCPLGCPLDAKRAMHVSYLPRAAAAGARIRQGMRVERLIVQDGQVRGVECRRSDGRAHRVRAGTVVVAGGALGTPELLLRSGLRHPRLGKGLRIHPACWVGARMERPVRGWEGVMQSVHVDAWADRGLLLEATATPLAFGAQWLPGAGPEHERALADFDRIASIGVHLHDRSSGRVTVGRDGAGRVRYRLGAADAEAIRFGIARTAELLFAAGAERVHPQIAGLPAIGPGEVHRIEDGRLRTRDLRLEAFHPMGTAAMDADPGAGVVDPEGRVRGVRGLVVADASLFPTSLGVNPMLTVIACAARVARGI